MQRGYQDLVLVRKIVISLNTCCISGCIGPEDLSGLCTCAELLLSIRFVAFLDAQDSRSYQVFVLVLSHFSQKCVVVFLDEE